MKPVNMGNTTLSCAFELLLCALFCGSVIDLVCQLIALYLPKGQCTKQLQIIELYFDAFYCRLQRSLIPWGYSTIEPPWRVDCPEDRRNDYPLLWNWSAIPQLCSLMNPLAVWILRLASNAFLCLKPWQPVSTYFPHNVDRLMLKGRFQAVEPLSAPSTSLVPDCSRCSTICTLWLMGSVSTRVLPLAW